MLPRPGIHTVKSTWGYVLILILIDFYFTDPPEANRCLSKGVSYISMENEKVCS